MSGSTGVEKMVIIGSGPAGWTAAIYGARANLAPLAIIGVPAANPAPVLPGGQLMLTTEVENYPGFPHGVSGPDMMALFQQQAERFGTRISHADVMRCDFTQRPFALETSEGETVRAHSVVIATGATANWVGLPNELRLAMNGGGVSACAVCDGALPAYRDQEVAVVGGGDTAMEEASYLTKFASKVYVIHRRDSFRASKIMQDRALNNPKIEMLWNTAVTDIVGKDQLESISLKNTVTGEESSMNVAGLFIAIGHRPNTDVFKGVIDMEDSGYLITRPDSTYTNIEGVFACGDVKDHVYRQAITAAGSGCMAAIDTERWLEHQH